MSDFKVSFIVDLVNKITGPARGVTGSLQKMRKGFGDNADSAKSLTSSLAKVSESGKTVTATASKIAAASNTEAGEIRKASEASSKLRLTWQQAINTGKRYSGMLQKQTGLLEKQSQATKKLEDARAKFDKSMATSRDMGLVGAGASAVGSKMRSGLWSTVSDLRPLEAAMGDLRTLGIQDVDAIKNRALAMQGTLSGVTADSFTRAAYDIKSGISTLSDEGVAAMTASAVATAKATKGQAEQMTSLFATGYGIFKQLMPEQSDAEFGATFSAALAKSVQQFKTDGAKMQQAIQSAGAGATLTGMSFDEQFTVLGMLQQKMEAGVAGTGLKAFAQRAADADAKFKKMGLSINMLDESGKMNSMTDILTQMKTEFGGEYNAQIGLKLKKAFGSDEALAVIQGLWGQEKAFKANSTAISEATKQGMLFTNQMANAAEEGNLDAQLSLLSQQWLSFKQAFATQLVPLIATVVSVLKPIVGWITRWTQEHPKLTAAIAITAAGAALLVSAIGGLFVAGAGLISTMAGVSLAMTTLGIKLPLLGLRFGILRVAALKSAGVLMHSFFPAIMRSTVLRGAGNGILGFFRLVPRVAMMAGSALMSVASAAIPVLMGAFQTMSAVIMSIPVFGWIIAGVTAVSFLVWKYWSPIKEFVGSMWTGAVEGLAALWSPIKKLGSFLATALNPLKWFKSIGGWFGGVKEKSEGVVRPAMAAAAMVTPVMAAQPQEQLQPVLPQVTDQTGVVDYVRKDPGEPQVSDLTGKISRTELDLETSTIAPKTVASSADKTIDIHVDLGGITIQATAGADVEALVNELEDRLESSIERAVSEATRQVGLTGARAYD